MAKNTAFAREGYLRENYHYFHLRDTAGQERDFHFHEFDKIVLLLSGRVDYFVESEVYALEPWSLLLVKHHTIHKALIDKSEPYDRVIIYLDRKYFERIFPDMGIMDSFDAADRLGRHLLRLLDTAGIRETDDQIERMGVERSLAAAQEADLALFVVDGSKPFSAEDQEAMDAALGARACIALMNKTDLGQVIEASDLPFDYVVPISAKNGMGMELLEQAMDMLFADDAPCDGSLLTNARQAEAIVRARDSLRLAQRSMQAGLTPDAVLVDVEAAMLALGEVTGRTMREDITNRIFERFCVGK